MEPIGALHRAAAVAQASAPPVAPVDPRLKAAFVRMVQYEIKGGVLRYSKRRELLSFARKLGLSDFEAHLLIAQAQYGDSPLEPCAARQPVEPAYLVTPRQTPTWLKASLAVLAAAAIDLALIYWMLF
jgi:hypothetical protein